MKTEFAMRKHAYSAGKTWEKELTRIVERLVRRYHPEKIVLFGSLAKGEESSESDIDLLVIKRTGERRVNRRVEALRGISRKIPLDVIVLTPEEVEFLRKEGSSFIQEVLSTGKVLYEQKPLV
jgi:predicted nucleotidyltransferase